MPAGTLSVVDAGADRRLRAVRGVTASTVTTLVAATAHTLAGSGAPAPLLVAGAALLAAPPAVALVGRRASVLRTSAAVLAAQAVFHVLFALFADTDAVAYTPAAGLSHHAAMHAAPTMTIMHASSGMHDMSPGSPMLFAHVLAALVTVALLHRGERMLQALGRGIRRLLPRLVLTAPQPVVRRRIRSVFVVAHRPAPQLASVLSRRGPPQPAF